jgi:YVTN family beta-propeller protein
MKRAIPLSITGASLVAMLILGAASGSATQVPAGTIWVTERTPGGLSTVAAIDSRTGESRGITSVGDAPIGITKPNGTHKVYSSSEGADQMSVIDADTVTVIGTIDMGQPSGPHHLMASTNGHYLYVGEYEHNKVGVVDTRVDENVYDIQASDVPGAHTHAVWITPNGKDLYATNEGPVQNGPGTFSKIDVGTGTIVWEYGVGRRPSEVLVDHDVAYVSVRFDNVIRAYDISGEVPVLIGTAEANSSPDTLSLTNDGRTLIVGLRGSPARMAFVDTETFATQYLSLPPGTTTGHQWLSRNGGITFMALEGAPGRIAVVDNRERQLITTYTYPNGRVRPHGVFYDNQK